MGMWLDDFRRDIGYGLPQRLAIAWMTPNGLDFLGVKPALGRVFGAADAVPGAPPVAVMNHRAWVTTFGADPGVVGRTLMLDGEGWTVIGVIPPRFEWNIPDLWLPDALERSDVLRFGSDSSAPA